ncbi:inner membrane-spanning protein YciB [Paracoccus sediminicola]|uniref:inner membrane-spanning protein YciB n=1 Tax=Paracoccus sediminicola TaxID=3017783 RepID=UPI0022F0AC07|nr:inner membrane-spanning protein YciB [Paracoccus sediminicola]WBU57063.1 septation protein IspZ [Paracoccus sediminicola]
MSDTQPKQVSPGLKIALEYGPLIVFFAVFMLTRDRVFTLWGEEYGGFVLATMVFVPVLVASILALWRLTGKLSAMQVMTLVLVVVFGGLTIWLNDDRFFKMKPTIIYAIFAGLLGLGLALKKNWLQLVLGEALPMEHEGWIKLTFRMALLFAGLALANEFVWRTMSDTAWVNFKTFGMPLITFLFLIANAGLFRRYALDKED